MVRFLKFRPCRRPVTVLGAACTSAFFGVFFLNKVLLNTASCASSCATTRNLSYERLQKNEAARKVSPTHPTVKRFQVNFLPSNSPIEDRFVAGIDPSLGAAMFSVIDGHKGYHCSDYLQGRILQYVSSHLHSSSQRDTDGVNAQAENLQILLDMHSSKEKDGEDNSLREGESYLPQDNLPLFSESTLDKVLSEAFLSLDNSISNTALSDMKLVLQGHSFTDEIKERVMRAVDGACAIAAVVLKDTISVASTGDCRIVVGRKLPNGAWDAIPLSVDQNAQNPSEVARLKREHPGEENTVIIGNRVLGSLMPFRTFGDIDFKWETKYLGGVIPSLPFYRTPPYITAEPVVSHHTLAEGDRFMILASDGLWERMSNENAVRIVAEAIGEAENTSDSSVLGSLMGFLRGSKHDGVCCNENAATRLLWEALGGTDKNVSELLDIPPPWSRMYRDDITIMVVHFKD